LQSVYILQSGRNILMSEFLFPISMNLLTCWEYHLGHFTSKTIRKVECRDWFLHCDNTFVILFYWCPHF
jgi:hypothetical protein